MISYALDLLMIDNTVWNFKFNLVELSKFLNFRFIEPTDLRNDSTTDHHLIGVLMGCNLGAKLVADAKTTLDGRCVDTEMMGALESAFNELPTSYDAIRCETSLKIQWQVRN
jgi:hypothetical protein